MLSTSREAGRNFAGSGKRPRSRFRRMLGLAILGLASIGTPGCMTFHNGFKAMTSNGTWNDTVVVLRNRSMATKAWHRRKHHFCNEKYMNDYCAGFRAGYEASAKGGDGCTPSFPPKDYWSWEFQSAEGQGRTSAWFAGFPQGARAAEEDGISNWNQLPMGANLQAQYQQSGMFDHQGAVYPIPEPAPWSVPGPTSSAIGAPTRAFPMLNSPGEPVVGVPMGSELLGSP